MPAKKKSTPNKRKDLALNGDILPSTLVILPVFERPFLPAQNLPIFVDEQPWFETLNLIGDNPQHIAGLVLINTEAEEEIEKDTELTTKHFHEIGTVIRVISPTHSDGKIQFIAEGLQRFRITEWVSETMPYTVKVEYLDDTDDSNQTALKAYAMAIIKIIKELIPLSPLFSEELKLGMDRFTPNHPSYLADFAAGLTTATKQELQKILETLSVLKRMKHVLQLIRKELEVTKLQYKISEKVEDTIDDQQRQFFLREQLKAIQQELGISKDDRVADSDEFKEKIKNLTLTEQAQNRIDEELKKLTFLESGSPEYNVTRSYLDWITALPWGILSKDRFNLKQAKEVLDQDHDGLDDVKKRIIEFIALGKLRNNIGGSIILLVGPPGVGKTSIGKSIATALNREFFRFSIGGMRDEAEIKGHRRTYICSMPGKIIQALKEVNVSNPVVMLDEIDKM
ncbi:MAG: AAA family ATPase, partial [Methylococcales bacterium]|nr:AAA family ATPase [Methylococcales bacterium]